MAGKYRLIDIPISNCINSGIYYVAVLTQFNTISLHRHITRTYYFDAFHKGWVQIWAAEQTNSSSDWYQGTADAVRKQLLQIRSARSKYVLVLAGDHLYRMDFSKLFESHVASGADISIAVRPASMDDAKRFGILKRNKDHLISDFAEKPKDPQVLQDFVSRDDPDMPLLASTGIYLFNVDTLAELLESNNFEDFGGQVIPAAIRTHKVFGYDFEGFWEDIGTIRSFYDTNLLLTKPNPPFDFFDPNHPVYTRPRYLPGSIITQSTMTDTLMAEGCCIDKAEINHSIIGLRSQIRNDVTIRDTIIMGMDYYENEYGSDRFDVPLGIDSNCNIEGAIIDKNARIGHDTIIRSFPRGTDIDTDRWVVRDGIVVIPKNMVIPPNTKITP